MATSFTTADRIVNPQRRLEIVEGKRRLAMELGPEEGNVVGMALGLSPSGLARGKVALEERLRNSGRVSRKLVGTGTHAA